MQGLILRITVQFLLDGLILYCYFLQSHGSNSNNNDLPSSSGLFFLALLRFLSTSILIPHIICPSSRRSRLIGNFTSFYLICARFGFLYVAVRCIYRLVAYEPLRWDRRWAILVTSGTSWAVQATLLDLLRNTAPSARSKRTLRYRVCALSRRRGCISAANKKSGSDKLEKEKGCSSSWGAYPLSSPRGPSVVPLDARILETPKSSSSEQHWLNLPKRSDSGDLSLSPLDINRNKRSSDEGEIESEKVFPFTSLMQEEEEEVLSRKQHASGFDSEDAGNTTAGGGSGLGEIYKAWVERCRATGGDMGRHLAPLVGEKGSEG